MGKHTSRRKHTSWLLIKKQTLNKRKYIEWYNSSFSHIFIFMYFFSCRVHRFIFKKVSIFWLDITKKIRQCFDCDLAVVFLHPRGQSPSCPTSEKNGCKISEIVYSVLVLFNQCTCVQLVHFILSIAG